MVPLPSNKTPIGCKWVYEVKLKSDGSLERYKARLVAKGFTQREGMDFHETFSPVVKMTTIWSVIAIVASKHWPLHQLDVNNARMHCNLYEDVYMLMPEGIPNPSHLVCKLNKSLYGLKQASRQWVHKLTSALQSLHYVQSKNDYSHITKRNAEKSPSSLFVWMIS